MIRVMTWCAVSLEAAWLLLALVFGSDAGLSVFALLTIFWGAVGLLGLWAVRFILYLLGTRRERTLRRFKVWALEPLLILAVATSVWFGLLLWPRFLLSLPALDRYVHDVRQDPPPSRLHPPRIVGLFMVRETEALPEGVVRLIRTSCMFDDCRLAYGPTDTKPPRIGEDHYDRLASGWWPWWRSW